MKWRWPRWLAPRPDKRNEGPSPAARPWVSLDCRDGVHRGCLGCYCSCHDRQVA